MLELPFFIELKNARNILLAGAGGGFDIFSGLPLYFGLKDAGKTVHLANLSFSILPPPETSKETRLSPALCRVVAETPAAETYFPELRLARWFQEQGNETPIYCFERTGVKPLLAGYRALVEHLSLDTVILIDGGTDSLMRGDESGLGTPQEDIASIAAVNELAVERKFLTCLGFGVDFFHGVRHADFMEAVAELTRNQGYLGSFSLLEEMPEVQSFRRATESVFRAMPHDISIVCSSILSALSGHYGNHQATSRTWGSELWINPLMPVCWCFRLAAVARRILYLDAMRGTETYADVQSTIKKFRRTCSPRLSQAIPGWK
jgi:hypothetical protein